MLTVIPAMEVIQHVREKFTCRACEKISSTGALSRYGAAAFAGRAFCHDPFEKYGQHQPL